MIPHFLFSNIFKLCDPVSMLSEKFHTMRREEILHWTITNTIEKRKNKLSLPFNIERKFRFIYHQDAWPINSNKAVAEKQCRTYQGQNRARR